MFTLQEVLPTSNYLTDFPKNERLPAGKVRAVSVSSPCQHRDELSYPTLRLPRESSSRTRRATTIRNSFCAASARQGGSELSTGFSPGSLVRARGRDWIVLPDQQENVLRLRPVLSENYIRPYWWCSPARTGMARMVPERWTARCKGASFCNAKCVRA